MEITEESLFEAAKHLGQTDRGRQAMVDLLVLLYGGGLSLDTPNQKAFLILLHGAFGDYPGNTLDAINEVIDSAPDDAEESA